MAPTGIWNTAKAALPCRVLGLPCSSTTEIDGLYDVVRYSMMVWVAFFVASSTFSW